MREIIQFNRIYCLIALFICILPTYAARQNFPKTASVDTYTLTGRTSSKNNGAPLSFSAIELLSNNRIIYRQVSNIDGVFTFVGLSKGTYTIIVRYIGYHNKQATINLQKDSQINIILQEATTNLQGVVITASESKGLTSASTIGREALEHIQPSSFSDVLALLPGNTTHTPNLTAGNVATLREVGISSSDYAVTGQGTQFIVDGAIQQQDANLQYVAQGFTNQDQSRNMINYGMDMRNLSTDDIEKVEVIRGIPSVRYGDMTSGVINITRRLRATPLEARFKADEYTKLIHVNKGLAWNEDKQVVHFDLGFLDSKADPRNPYETYQRLLFSTRYKHLWNWENSKLRWTISGDYRSTLDSEKEDPDIARQAEDSYKSSYSYYGLNSRLEWRSKKEYGLKEISLQTAINYSQDKITRTKFVQLDRDQAAPTSMEEGEHDAEVLPTKYTGHLVVDGNPLNSNIELRALFQHKLGVTTHRWTVGSSWRYSKNYGDGQVYDPTRPINYGTSLRPRAYHDIPGKSLLAGYLEDRMEWSIGRSHFILQAGIRGNTLLGLDKKYKMQGKWYLDPRINAQWELPKLYIGEHPLQLDLTAGWGKMTMLPSIHQLYPNKQYWDFDELNYYHENRDYRRIYTKTFIVDTTPYDIEPSTNTKYELRFGANYQGNNLSVTYFKERMVDGFRYSSSPTTFTYRKFDTSGIEGSTLTGPPTIEDLPSTEKTVLSKRSILSNGTRVLKEGIEFQGSTKRFSKLNTRITVSGAWFKTTYTNSGAQWDNSYDQVVLNKIIRDMYIGHYDWTSGYIKQQFNTNFTFDTYLKKLGFILSTTVECMWWSKRKDLIKSGTPFEYMDINGVIHPYTDESAQDMYLTHLIQPQPIVSGGDGKEPFYALVNLKASKTFGKWIKLSLFVDRILDYTPDYKVAGLTVRRSANPYFGMEIKCSF